MNIPDSQKIASAFQKKICKKYREELLRVSSHRYSFSDKNLGRFDAAAPMAILPLTSKKTASSPRPASEKNPQTHRQQAEKDAAKEVS